MNKITTVLLSLLVAACASRTDYQHFEEDEGGYRHKKIADDLYVVNFTGNSETEKDTTRLFAKFRAIELCREQNYKLAHIMHIAGDINQEEVIRNYGYPSSYFGLSPFYSRYGYAGTGLYGGVGTYGYGPAYGGAYVDTITWPEVSAVFACANEVYVPKVEFVEIPNEEVKKFTKDEKGAVKVQKIPENSPNQKNLQAGDIIIKASGQRVETAYQIVRHFSPEKMTIEATILRNGKKKEVKINSANVTEEVAETQKKIILMTCEIDDFEHDYCK